MSENFFLNKNVIFFIIFLIFIYCFIYVPKRNDRKQKDIMDCYQATTKKYRQLTENKNLPGDVVERLLMERKKEKLNCFEKYK